MIDETVARLKVQLATTREALVVARNFVVHSKFSARPEGIHRSTALALIDKALRGTNE